MDYSQSHVSVLGDSDLLGQTPSTPSHHEQDWEKYSALIDYAIRTTGWGRALARQSGREYAYSVGQNALLHAMRVHDSSRGALSTAFMLWFRAACAKAGRRYVFHNSLSRATTEKITCSDPEYEDSSIIEQYLSSLGLYGSIFRMYYVDEMSTVAIMAIVKISRVTIFRICDTIMNDLRTVSHSELRRRIIYNQYFDRYKLRQKSDDFAFLLLKHINSCVGFVGCAALSTSLHVTIKRVQRHVKKLLAHKLVQAIEDSFVITELGRKFVEEVS